jgi:hypothetical protein
LCKRKRNVEGREKNVKGWIDDKERGGNECQGRAIYGMFFGPKSEFNISCELPRELAHKSQAVELYAVRATIQCFRHDVLIGRKTIGKLVIMANSEFLVDGLSKNVWGWEEKGY